jgi:CRISPR-associated protein Csm5
MNFDYTLFEVTVTPLTPLHIGSGNRLLKDYDYAVAKGQTWRIDETALLEAQQVEDPAMADTLARTPPAQLLKPEDFRSGSRFFRYTLEGQPRSTEAGAELQEQIKTVKNEAYLPGSSLKGAIRTALAWHGWAEKNLKPTMRDLERRRKFAGRRIEQRIMGPNPNHDLLRALHIADSVPAGKDNFLILNAQVVTQGGLGSPIELEAVKPDTTFQLAIKVDKALFNQWAKKSRLQLGGNSAWLEQLPQLIQRHTAQRVQNELAWYQNRGGAAQTVSFYRRLHTAQLPAGSCLLQLGWGTGWSDKTYGSHLQKDRRFMEELIATYNLAMGRREQGDPFPRSRRVMVEMIKDGSGQSQLKPIVPLGWALMEMKEHRK